MSSPQVKANGNGSRNRRLRILQIGKFYPPRMGGMESHLQVLCDGMREYADVRVLVSNSHRGHIVERINGVPVERLRTTLTLSGAPICPAMVSRIRKANADIIHLHLPNPAALLAYLASGTRAKLVITYHSDVIRQRLLDIAFRPFLVSTLRRADAILAATPKHIDSSPVLVRHRPKCCVVPFGIPLDAFSQSADACPELREKYGERLILTVGRLVYYKGLDTLIRAMAAVRGHLLVVGEGPMREELEAQARSLGVADRVSFVGSVDDVTPYYQMADLFVLASTARSEAFGIVQLEAMACGKPVVNTNLDSGVPFVSRDGETGITVPPGEPVALAAAINKLLDDPQLRAQYGRAARRRVEAEFSQERMVESTVRIYDEVMSSNGATWVTPAAKARRRIVQRTI